MVERHRESICGFAQRPLLPPCVCAEHVRGTTDDPEVLLFDIGAGEALEIPTAFSDFHDVELTEYTDAALASDFFEQWLHVHPEPIPFDRCVGYDVPLFLGGTDDLRNLSLTDLDVYWTLTGQLRARAFG